MRSSLGQFAVLLASTIHANGCADNASARENEIRVAGLTITETTPEAGAIDRIIPKPVLSKATDGVFTLGPAAKVYVNPWTTEMRAVGQYLSNILVPSTGYDIEVLSAFGNPANGNIYLALTNDTAILGEEEYRLVVTPHIITLVANQPQGLFRGFQTLRQMLPVAIERTTLQSGPWTVPTGEIRDYPRFAWRGAMLDVARHFFSVDEVKRYIDLIASYKMNRFHIHLTDNQGWRIAIHAWPNLSVRGGSTAAGGGPGGFYTQADYADIVAYAQARYITVVPEIDMPGHTNAALASYAELNCSGQIATPYSGIEAFASSLCINKDITYSFVGDVIKEMAALTPGPYMHIGGDEARATRDVDYIQFVSKVHEIVESTGKQMIGWEEITKAPLAATAIAQHWYHDDLAVTAVQRGMRLIMSPVSRTYLDLKYDSTTLLGLDWAGYTNEEQAYTWDPLSELKGLSQDSVLGVESPLWSETLRSLSDAEYLAFPRVIGHAEIGWSQRTGRNWDEYKVRLSYQGPRLRALGVNFYMSSLIPWK